MSFFARFWTLRTYSACQPDANVLRLMFLSVDETLLLATILRRAGHTSIHLSVECLTLGAGSTFEMQITTHTHVIIPAICIIGSHLTVITSWPWSRGHDHSWVICAIRTWVVRTTASALKFIVSPNCRLEILAGLKYWSSTTCILVHKRSSPTSGVKTSYTYPKDLTRTHGLAVVPPANLCYLPATSDLSSVPPATFRIRKGWLRQVFWGLLP